MSLVAAKIQQNTQNGGLGKYGMVFACGTALFSDGYQNGVVGEINTILKILYPAEYKLNMHGTLFSSMAFAGTVLGMLIFGILADKVGRKFGMIAATLIVFVFTALAAGAYSGGSITGMLQALIAYRFLSGIGIGAEYPSGSVACSENTENPDIPKNIQHALFAFSTNGAIDWGFVFAALVPLILIKIFGSEDYGLAIVWRMSFVIGCIPPLLVLFWRMRMTEPLRFQKEAMKNVSIPWTLVARKYWRPFLGISLAWFVYDFISYPFGIYSSTILDVILPSDAGLVPVFGWNVVINLFYIPGTVIGALFIDRVKPKNMMIYMLVIQAIVGFIMSGLFAQLSHQVAAFAVVYGLFLSFGEAGPGNCLGLLASKSFPTAVRGTMYGLCAAIGKIGAFVGTWAFPAIIAAFPAGDSQSSGPFWVGSGLAIFSAIVIYLLVPEIPADCMTRTDEEFRAYLEVNGFDTSGMGLHGSSGGFIEDLFAPGTLEKDAVESDAISDEDEKIIVA